MRSIKPAQQRVHEEKTKPVPTFDFYATPLFCFFLPKKMHIFHIHSFFFAVRIP